MKSCLTFILFLILSSNITLAQSTVTIRGKMIEADSKYPLYGASAILNSAEGNGSSGIVGVATDEFGDFTIRTSEKGSRTLTLSFIGFNNKSIPITIGDDDINLGTIEISPNSTELEGVVITASLEGQQLALNQQRMSDNIKSVVSSDVIGRNPDLNVAEALQRIPGVNIQRDKGEGATVSIRGTPAHFTTIQINGEQMPSVQGDGSRNESLDLIPADQLASMEITKAPTPDMDGDAIGGVVNLKTPVARKYDWGIRAEAAIGYNDISGNPNGVNRLRIDKRFLKSDAVPEGKLGIILGGSQFQSNNSEHRADAVWTDAPVPVESLNESVLVIEDYRYAITENERTRTGLTGTLDYKFNQDHKLIFNYMYNRRKDDDVRNRSRFDLPTEGSPPSFQTLDSIVEGRVRRDINVSDEIKENQSFNLQGDHTINDWKLEWGAFYTRSNRTFSGENVSLRRENIDIVADNPGGINAELPLFRTAIGEPSIYDPFTYNTFRNYRVDFETIEADNIVGRLDVIKHFNFLKKHDAFFKFGGKYRTQTNSKYRNQRTLRFDDPNNLINQEEAFLRILSGDEQQEFLNSDYRFGPLIGREEFESYVTSNRRILSGDAPEDIADSRRASLNDTYDARETISSAYAMTRVQINKLMVLAGVRYEQNSVDYDAFDVRISGDRIETAPLQGGTDYGFLLPNLHMKYNLDDYTAIRFSTVFNYARPNFVDIVPFVNFNADSPSLALGNPDLQPASALNIDLMFEKFFSNVGVFSIGVFYKDIDQFQFERRDPLLAQDFPGFPDTQGSSFRQEQNGENAIVLGAELNFVRALDFLPGFLKKLSFDGNYTYAYSDAFTQDREGITLPGQAEHTFNASLAGDFGSFTARLSANYNGTFVNSLASRPQDDIFQQERLQLDSNASYQINKNWRINAEFTNITNAPSIRFQGARERRARTAFFGWQTRIGVSYRL